MGVTESPALRKLRAKLVRAARAMLRATEAERRGAAFWRNLCAASGMLPLLQQLAAEVESLTEGTLAGQMPDFAEVVSSMLRGCANLGCRNVAGACEAGLKARCCSRCMNTRYCGAACQREAWPSHRKVCVAAGH